MGNRASFVGELVKMNYRSVFSLRDNLQNRIRERPFFYAAVFVSWLFWLYLAANTPYGLDDWKWGIPLGLEELKTASLNSRYVGNALEVTVSRSRFLKTFLMGTMETLTPFLSVMLVQRWRTTEGERPADDRFLAFQFVIVNLIYLTLPQEVWRQTYGWIAGFSNYGLAAFLLVVSQGIMLDGREPGKKHSAGFVLACFLIGVMVQLVLENVTIFMVFFGMFAVLEQLFALRRCSTVRLVFLAGIALGAFIMFSGKIYNGLLTTGHSEGFGRWLSFKPDMSLLGLIPFLYYRSLYFLPGNLWGNNWLACLIISLCMALAAKKMKQGLIKNGIIFSCLCFALFFVFNRFAGPIEHFVPRWSDMLSQRLHFLFFWAILIFIFLLFRGQKKVRRMLLLLWFLSPLVIAPMAAVTSIPGRCFLPTVVFLSEFCMLLCQQEVMKAQPRIRKAGVVLLLFILLVSTARMTVVFTSLGKAEKQREALIKEAKEAQASSLYLPDYPYEYDHFITEPLKGGGQMVYFREFYQVPDSMELVFDPVD